VKTHLLNGVGFYEQLSYSLLEDIGWSKRVLDKVDTSSFDFYAGSTDKKVAKTAGDIIEHYKTNVESQCFPSFAARPRSLSQIDVETQARWLREALHGCLMRLGDLCRYLADKESLHLTTARRFYHQALRLDPSKGLPFNQLASLKGSPGANQRLNSALNYLKW